MQILGDLTHKQLREALAGPGLRIRVGPYVYSIQSHLPVIAEGLSKLYGDFSLAEQPGFADFHVALRAPNVLQRARRKLDFYLDDHRPFNRIEFRHAYAFLEWGMNWCVSVHTNEYLKLHAAVVARDDVAVILPGLPGSGKSTLCAALALQGWRVLSDEHALVPLGSSQVVPLYRPVSLKNESIAVIKAFSDKVVLGPLTEDTHKGVVAHMKADLSPTSHEVGPLPAKLMIFPQYETGASLALNPRMRAECFMFAGHHSFNYSVLSARGFAAMTTLMDAVDCYDLRYGDMDDALRVINDLQADLCAG